jgi:hypothetical protein
MSSGDLPRCDPFLGAALSENRPVTRAPSAQLLDRPSRSCTPRNIDSALGDPFRPPPQSAPPASGRPWRTTQACWGMGTGGGGSSTLRSEMEGLSEPRLRQARGLPPKLGRTLHDGAFAFHMTGQSICQPMVSHLALQVRARERSNVEPVDACRQLIAPLPLGSSRRKARDFTSRLSHLPARYRMSHPRRAHTRKGQMG